MHKCLSAGEEHLACTQASKRVRMSLKPFYRQLLLFMVGFPDVAHHAAAVAAAVRHEDKDRKRVDPARQPGKDTFNHLSSRLGRWPEPTIPSTIKIQQRM